MSEITRAPNTAHRWPGRAAVALVLALAGLAASAEAVTVTVVDQAGQEVTGYRWLIQEDTTRASTPGAPAVPGSHLSVSFHTSYAPPLASGCVGCPANGPDPAPPDASPASVVLDPGRRYFVSVLPVAGHSMGGAPVAPGQSAVTVTVSSLPVPTARISVFVFEDTQPINNAPDLPEEHGLAGFKLLLFDAGGRYGISGGQMSQDAYGNPLGTTYFPCPAGSAGCTPTVSQMGQGFVTTGADGTALVDNLAPGKYSIQAVPPTGQDWHQTSTIEGTKTIDAWVKSNEPPYFQEFGPPGYHVFIGFVRTFSDPAVLVGGSTITGRVVNLHNSRPPDFAFYDGEPVPNAWVGLNTGSAGVGKGVYAAPCHPTTGEFSIPNVPAGSYRLVIWDDPLDLIFATHGVTVPAGGADVALHDVPVFNWFGRLDSTVFWDGDEDGFRDAGEVGLPGQVVNLRFRDGSVYQTATTDPTGRASFKEVFPFFNWLTAEVDFTRYKATGATTVVDAGGPVMPDEGWDYPSRGKLQPQEQLCTQADLDAGSCTTLGAPLVNPNTGNNLSRTETGPVLVAGVQTFLGQTNVIEFGKKSYLTSENGGISGIVQYAVVRAENDPRFAVAEPWEPGVPRVQVVLYADANADRVVDDLDGSGTVDLADVDNFPFDWSAGGPMGPEDLKRNGDPACQEDLSCVWSEGDALQVAVTDSWDDSLPTGCQGDVYSLRGVPTDCFDGLRSFNQVRPAVFDGGYAFGSAAGDETLPPGVYIVEAVPPPGFETVKEEDKNVDFGETYTPPVNPDALPPICVGQPHVLPQYLALFPDQQVPNPSNDPYVPGKTSPLCDMKQVTLQPGQNAPASFFVFTEVPVAGHAVGFILDDLANEFDPTAPTFGEKHAPPHLPVSIQDWTGREINRVYADEYGAYNALVPATYNANLPMPSGYAPTMLQLCMNHPGPILDSRPGSPTFGSLIEDPYFDRQYSQFCYTFQFMPGTTTYLDTPVLPVAAFAGPGQFPLDCELQTGTPMIYSVSGTEAGGGPWVSVANGTKSITIVSAGRVEVPNPLYSGPGGTSPATVLRDYGFGSVRGTVVVQGGSASYPLTVTSWSPGVIVATVPSGTRTGQLRITRGDNQRSSVVGVTLHVGGATPRAVAPGGSIQAAIDAATPDSLILVPPGAYKELVIMWKPVRLQGWGALSVQVNAAKTPTEKLLAWRAKVNQLVASGAVTLLPGQNGTTAGLPEPALFVDEEGPGIFVLARNANPPAGFGRVKDPNYAGLGGRPNARIDGFTVTGADNGGAIMVNGFAHWLQITNNRIASNQGVLGGGIRVGHPQLTYDPPGAATADYVNARNDNIAIEGNQIIENGGLGGAGGGISLCTGSDNYRVSGNFICGNFTTGDGGGVGHLGLSPRGRIAGNQILFNQSFNQGVTVNGGGILVSGAAPLTPGGLTPGSGDVVINANLLQGNLSGAGDGGAIRAQHVNGQDVARSSANPARWHTLNIINNMVVNNVAGLAGGGISLQDVARSNILFNTITHNDSTGTAGEAFPPGSPGQSEPQPAGVVSRAHSAGLAAAIAPGAPAPYRTGFSNPALVNNIIFKNRSFYFTLDDAVFPPLYRLQPDPATPVYVDLAVLGTPTPQLLNPTFSLLTNPAGYAPSNLGVTMDGRFVAEYYNGASNMVQMPELTTAISVAPAFDEGGNFVDVRFGPLSQGNPPDPATDTVDGQFGDYHVLPGAPVIGAGTLTLPGVFTEALLDFDGNPRVANGTVDIGADEWTP